MKLRSKLILIILFTWVFILIALVVESYTVILSDYRKMEIEDVGEIFQRTQEAEGRMMDALNTILLDWARWTELYNFLKVRSPAFIKTNLWNATTFQDLKINFILFYDDQGHLISSNGYDLISKQFKNVSPEIITYIETNKSLLQHSDIANHKTGFAKVGQNVIAISSYPITNSEATAKPMGNVIMGYYFNDIRLQNLAQTLQVSMDLFSIETLEKYPNLLPWLETLKTGASYDAIPRNDNILDIYTLLFDLNHQPIGVLKIIMPRVTYVEGLHTIHTYLFTVLIVGLLTLILVQFLIKKFVIQRITSFNSHLKDMTSTLDFTKESNIRGNDEISEMLESNNTLLNVINQSEIKLNELISRQEQDLLERKNNEKKLSELNQQLTQTLSEMHKNERKLAQANDTNEQTVVKLKQQEREAVLINKINELLQICLNSVEAYPRIKVIALQLFPKLSGSLSVLNKDSNRLEMIESWGPEQYITSHMSPNDCFAIRGGNILTVNDTSKSVICPHYSIPPRGGLIELPMIVQGDIIGLLAFFASDGQKITEKEQQLCIIFNNTIKTSLANIRLRELLSEQSMHDPLTGLYNRRYLNETLTHLLQYAVRNSTKLSVAMLDLDFFKRFNDTCGHDAGDEVLNYIGKLLQDNFRGSDIACRYGGEEFIIVMIDTDLKSATTKMEAICEEVRQNRISHDGKILPQLTISIGVATLSDHSMSADDLILNADKALYIAKQSGRDRVEAFGSKKNLKKDL